MRPYMLSPRDRGTENPFRIVALAKKELIVAQIPQAQRNAPLHPCIPWLAVRSGPLPRNHLSSRRGKYRERHRAHAQP
jgi:hypothetical protein